MQRAAEFLHKLRLVFLNERTHSIFNSTEAQETKIFHLFIFVKLILPPPLDHFGSIDIKIFFFIF